MSWIRPTLPRGSDWINPIVVKELRQAVRNWSVTGVLLLFLTIALLVVVVFLFTYSIDVAGGGASATGMGQPLFAILQGLLMLAMLVFVPAYTMARLSAERSDTNIDLLFSTTISPWAIVRGKLFSGLTLNVLFLSACMPFMVFSYLLRGIDLPTILLFIASAFLLSIIAIHGAIFLACLPLSRPFRILIIVLIGFSGLWSTIPLAFLSFHFGSSGIGSRMGGAAFWTGVASALTIGGCALALLHVSCAAMISPPHANRALPVRLCLLTIWLILGGMALLELLSPTGGDTSLKSWSLLFAVLLSLCMLVTVAEPETPSLRVQRAIPRARLWRVPAFLLYSGPAGGLIFVTLLGLAGPALAQVLTVFHDADPFSWRTFTRAASVDRIYVQQGTIVLYALSYTLTALFLRRLFFRSGVNPATTGALALMVATAVIVTPFIITASVGDSTRVWQSGIELGNVFALGYTHRTGEHVVVAAVWACLGLLLNARWFAAQVRNFRPLAIQRPPPPPPG